MRRTRGFVDAGPISFVHRTVDELTIEGERALRAVPLYADLKEVIRRAGYAFRVLPPGSAGRWDRALFLNLTYWGGVGGDVLETDRIDADVVAHAAWHHLSVQNLGVDGAPQSAAALFFGEAIASAFDVYLVGRLLGGKGATFLETQVPEMGRVARAAGLTAKSFQTLLREVAEDPESAFDDLRELLFDASVALHACRQSTQALGVLQTASTRRFGALLHRYELSNWVLYARAYAKSTVAARRASTRALRIDRQLRAVRRAREHARRARPRGAGGSSGLSWLIARWVESTLGRNAGA